MSSFPGRPPLFSWISYQPARRVSSPERDFRSRGRPFKPIRSAHRHRLGNSSTLFIPDENPHVFRVVPRRPETLEEIQDDRFGRRIPRPKAPKADFSQDPWGDFGKKRIPRLTLSSRACQNAREGKGGWPRKARDGNPGLFPCGARRASRVSRDPCSQTSRNPGVLRRVRPSPGRFAAPLHPRRKSSRILRASRADPAPGDPPPLAPRPLKTRLKAPLGAILPSDGNFPILPPSRRPAAPSWPSRGHPRLPPSGCAARATRAQPSRLPSPPCLPPHTREEGPTEDGGGLYANPAHARHASREGGPSESPLPPLPMPRKPRAHAPAHYAPSRTRGARSKCFAYTRERKRRDI